MSRRLRSLAVLHKLRDRALREKAAELSDVQNRLSIVEAARVDLARRRIEESRVTMPEAMPYVASFRAHSRREDERLAQAEVALHGHVDRLQGQVMECYQEARSVKQLGEVIADRILAERASKEALAADERSLRDHARKIQAASRSTE